MDNLNDIANIYDGESKLRKLTSKLQISNTNQTLKQSIDENLEELNSFSIEFDSIVHNYDNQNYFVWENMSAEEKEKHNFFIIPSPTQRAKISFYVISPSGFYSTWSSEHMGTAMLTWMTGIINPMVWLNTRLYKSDGIVLIYDGESKLHFIKNFLQNKLVFKVLEKNGRHGFRFTQPIQEFMGKASSYEKYGFGPIKTMLNVFKNQRTNKTINTDFLQPEWMKDNGYESILDKFLKNKVTVTLQDLEPDVEADVYQWLGSLGAVQSPSQLCMAHMKASVFKDLFHEEKHPHSKFKNLWVKTIDPKVKKWHVYNKIREQIIGGDGVQYKEQDVYLYSMFCMAFSEIDEGKLYFTDDLDYSDLINRFVRFFKPSNFDNVEFFNKRAMAYNSMSDDEKSMFITELKEKVIPHLDEIFRIIGTKRFQTDSLRNHTNQNTSTDTLTKKIQRKFVAEWNEIEGCEPNVSNDIKPKINLYAEDGVPLSIIILDTLKFLVGQSALNAKNTEDVLYYVLNIFEEKWAKFIFSNHTKDFTENTHGLSKGRDNWENKMGTDEYDSLGQFLAILGNDASLGLNTSVDLMHRFFDIKVYPELVSTYGNIKNTSTIRSKLKNTWEDSAPINEFLMINPHGDIYSFSEGDIGHCVPNASGNTITDTYFIFEEKVKNRSVYRDNIKDMVKYYSLCYIKSQEVAEEAFTNRDKKMLSKLDKVEETLKFLIKYHGITIDETIEFDEEGYIVEEKDAA